MLNQATGFTVCLRNRLMHLWEIFNTVLNGGALVLLDNEVRQSVSAD